jgi:hypothetical protein
VARVDVVEDLDHAGRAPGLLVERGAGELTLVERLEVAVALRVVVVRVEHDLAGQFGRRNLVERLERDAHHHDVAGRGSLGGGRRARLRAQLVDEVLEGLGTAGVAHHHVVAGRHREPRHRAADVPATDKSDRRHDDDNLRLDRLIPCLRS